MISFTQCLLFVLGSVHVTVQSPVQVRLQSKIPDNPIEDPASWAWGLHPDNGLDYKARDSLSLEVCLANPDLINTAKCKLPRDLCLSNSEYTPLVGCSGHKFPLDVCIRNPILTTRDNCAGGNNNISKLLDKILLQTTNIQQKFAKSFHNFTASHLVAII